MTGQAACSAQKQCNAHPTPCPPLISAQRRCLQPRRQPFRSMCRRAPPHPSPASLSGAVWKEWSGALAGDGEWGSVGALPSGPSTHTAERCPASFVIRDGGAKRGRFVLEGSWDSRMQGEQPGSPHSAPGSGRSMECTVQAQRRSVRPSGLAYHGRRGMDRPFPLALGLPDPAVPLAAADSQSRPGFAEHGVVPGSPGASKG